MKHIYTAPSKQAAELALNDFSDKWDAKYSYAIKSWRDNWDELTAFLTSQLKSEKLFLYYKFN